MNSNVIKTYAGFWQRVKAFVFDSESSTQQATWGKRLIGLKVTDYDSARIGFLRSFARTLLKFIPWELSITLICYISFPTETSSRMVNYGFGLVYFLFGLNSVSLIMTKEHQTTDDLIMKTYLVKQTS